MPGIIPMRPVVCTLLFLGAASAQFKSTVPLVVAPTTVTDPKGRYIDGLTAEDLILYDNNVPQAIQMDWMPLPISLVVAVQTSANSLPVIDKLGRTGILLTQLLAADAGETATISFSDDVKVHQDFTANPDLVTHSLRILRREAFEGRRYCPIVRISTPRSPRSRKTSINSSVSSPMPTITPLLVTIAVSHFLAFASRSSVRL